MSLLILLLVPAIVALVIYFFNMPKEEKAQRGYWWSIPKAITPKEFVIQLIGQSVVILLVYGACMFSSLSDIEVWNGRVKQKLKERVSCSHSYPCNPHDCMCSTDKDGRTSCSTCWDTCYDHDYDNDWNVYDTAGQTFTIDRVDRQGLDEPPDWTKVKIGEETASRHSYTNYIKYAHNSLFNRGTASTQFTYPEYPLNVRNYFKIDRLVDTAGVIADKDRWNLAISSVSADLGNKKQVNLVVVVTKDKPAEYFNGLSSAWAGAKKNDVVLVMNVDASNKITWADVLSLTKSTYFQVVLRDEVLKIGALDLDKILAATRTSIEKHYVRRPMADFKYLLKSMTISTGWFIFALIISVVTAIIISKFMLDNEL